MDVLAALLRLASSLGPIRSAVVLNDAFSRGNVYFLTRFHGEQARQHPQSFRCVPTSTYAWNVVTLASISQPTMFENQMIAVVAYAITDEGRGPIVRVVVCPLPLPLAKT